GRVSAALTSSHVRGRISPAAWPPGYRAASLATLRSRSGSVVTGGGATGDGGDVRTGIRPSRYLK
ncbi:MAG: hypothetical protein ACLGHP_05795, partial [Vicinamibacteria bacterium]